MNDTIGYTNYLEKRHFIFIIIIVLFIHFLFTLLFNNRPKNDTYLPPKENSIEIKFEDTKFDLDDEPIKLAPTNAQNVGVPIKPLTPETSTVPPAFSEENPVTDEPQDEYVDQTEDDESDVEEEKIVPTDLQPAPDLNKISEETIPEVQEVKPDDDKNKVEKINNEPREKDQNKKPARKVVKSRYGQVQRPTMPGFFEKMRHAAEKSGDAMFGDTIFVQGEPGVERDVLQMKLQSYLRKLPWYLTQSFNSQQHDLRKLLNKNKSLKPFKFTVTINKKGEVIKLALTGTTGDTEVDNLMMDIIRSASPFPFIPESLKRERLQLPGALDPYVMAQGASVIITG
jgi:outer membrane biosynthesis protein TonB